MSSGIKQGCKCIKQAGGDSTGAPEREPQARATFQRAPHLGYGNMSWVLPDWLCFQEKQKIWFLCKFLWFFWKQWIFKIKSIIMLREPIFNLCLNPLGWFIIILKNHWPWWWPENMNVNFIGERQEGKSIYTTFLKESQLRTGLPFTQNSVLWEGGVF